MNSIINTSSISRFPSPPSSLGGKLSFYYENGIKIGSVRVLPMDALIGGVYILYVAYYIKKFIESFFDSDSVVTSTVRQVKTFRDRVVQKIIYTVQAISSSMLFVDWGIDKGWFMVKCLARTVFKGVAHSMSVLFWGYNCFNNIQNLIALPGLIDKAVSAHLYERVELEPQIYKEWISLFSNFAFVISSGMQVLSLATGIVVAAGSIEFLVTASMALMAAGIVIDILFDSHDKVEATKLMFSTKEAGYTLLK